MSIFNTFTTDNKIVDFFIRNSRILNFLKILLVGTLVGMFAAIHLLLAFTTLILFVILAIFYEINIRRIKINGSLEITKSNLQWKTDHSYLELTKENIVKILIVKEFFFSIVSQGFKYVLIDIIHKDNSLSHLIVKKFSENKQEFDIIESLRTFSIYNSIAFEKK